MAVVWSTFLGDFTMLGIFLGSSLYSGMALQDLETDLEALIGIAPELDRCELC